MPSSPRLIRALLLILACVGIAAPAQASDNDNLDLGGYLRLETAWHSGPDGKLVLSRLSWEERVNLGIGENGELKLVTQAYYDLAFDIDGSLYDPLPTNEQDKLIAKGYRDDLIVKELYYRHNFTNWDLYLGRQYVVWGESDGLPILDIVNPRDYSEFVFKDFIDQRIPLDIFRASYYWGDWSLTGVVIPDIEPEKYALPGSDFALPPPISRIPVNLAAPVEVEDGLENAELGLRLAATLSDLDISLVYLDTWADAPTYYRSYNTETKHLDITPRYDDIKVYGGTLAAPVLELLVRAELAYYAGQSFSSVAPLATEGAVAKDYWHYMIGFDYEFITDWNITLQSIVRELRDYETGLEEDARNEKLSLNLSGKLLRERLRPSLLAIYDRSKRDYFAKATLTYELFDAATASIGAAVFNGPTGGLFGAYGDQDRYFCDLKYSF